MSNETRSLSVKPASQVDLSPQTFEQALTFSNYLAESDLVPKDFKGKPGNCLIAMQWGAELGLKPLQALSNIAVINGRAALWGDAVIALARSSPLCEYVQETDDGKTATCRVKRRGEAEEVRTFSMDDAKLAGLLGKQGPWAQYPKRMRQMRARAFALRDVFPDVLRGMPVAEEVMDSPRDMGTADEVSQWAPQLLREAGEAAAQGGKAYTAWWKTLAKEVQSQLAGTKEHKHNKELAQQADANRTVDVPPPAPHAVTGEIVPAAQDVAARMASAQTEDDLFAAMELANAMTPQDQQAHRAALEAAFDDHLAAIRGAA